KCEDCEGNAVPEVLDPAESLVAITVGNTKEGTLFPAKPNFVYLKIV
ncbi:16958_t:CDS:1, partial [Entrophospora sp. SA101]